MYFVDREKVEDILKYYDQQLILFEHISSWESQMEKAALERVTHIIIESILDVGNDMIDGFIMRDPGSYEDIIDILADEKVITDEMSYDLKQVVGYRKILVQQYTEIVHNDLYSDFKAKLPILRLFTTKIRHYLHNQLGPVSAFKN